MFGLNDNIRVHAPREWVEEIGRKLESLRRMYPQPAEYDATCRSAMEDGEQTGQVSRQYAAQK